MGSTDRAERRMWPLAARRAVAVLATVAALAGCGGAGQAASPPATVPGPLAEQAALPAPEAGAHTGTAPAATAPVEAGPEPGTMAALLGPGVEAVVATSVAEAGSIAAWAERPDDAAAVTPTWSVPVPNEFGGPAHFRVLDQVDGWLRVQLPVRPNGTEGWIAADQVVLSAVAHRVEIALGERRLRVLQGDAVVLEATVAVGRDSAPTPVGRYYLRDAFSWDASSVYGPYVLPLSGFSEHIEVINGGEAVVAIHGTNRPDLLGQAVSLGCIRLHNDVITELAHLIHPGTPVEIMA